jgi:hypothetical protein
MAEMIRSVEYYYATVPDKPGAGLEILSRLRDAGVNLVAYLGFPSGKGKSQIDLFPEDGVALKQAAKAARIKLSPAKRAFVVQGDDRVGAVAAINRRLADAKVNITAAAAASTGDGRYAMVVWVAKGAHQRAARALGV